MNFQTRDVIVKYDDLVVHRSDKLLIGGPCSVESKDQLFRVAEVVREEGFRFLRGGAFKPRTNPYSFQGMQEEGLILLKQAAEKFDLKIVTEIVDVSHLPLYLDTVDILQIGARNMSNFYMLKQLAGAPKPILLKRGFAARIEELLLAAEYLVSGGNEQVILCERGIRTFETATRATLDLASVPIVKKISPLPIIVDPSHATGRSDIVINMALAGLVAGADGIIVEVHPNPAKALCDGLQSLTLDDFRKLCREIKRLTPFLS
ncbi:MAG: 3-deoxy-7-phosphoheptulonate synthase [bacterium]